MPTKLETIHDAIISKKGGCWHARGGGMGGTYHNHHSCPEGEGIKGVDKIEGQGGRHLCGRCFLEGVIDILDGDGTTGLRSKLDEQAQIV